MAGFSRLADLLCGGPEVDVDQPHCEIIEINKHLKGVIVSALNELDWLKGEPDNRVAFYGPFLVRTILEVGATALIGRLDPTRLLIVKRTQQHGSYNTEEPWAAAIRWQGDVVDAKVGSPWAATIKYKDMTKALFGAYYIDIYWSVALRKAAESELAVGDWLGEMRAITIDEFSNSRRVTIGKLYSESSKGVHSEFVVPPGSLYDKVTIRVMASSVIKILSELGFLVNMLPHIAYRLEHGEAVGAINEIERVEIL